MKVQMLFNRETRGSIQYNEIDTNGNVVSITDGQIGVLYIRKTSEIGKSRPRRITVTVESAE